MGHSVVTILCKLKDCRIEGKRIVKRRSVTSSENGDMPPDGFHTGPVSIVLGYLECLPCIILI